MPAGRYGSYYRPPYHYGGYYPGYRSTFVVTGAFGYPSYWHNPWSFGIGFSFGYGYGGYGYGFGPYGYGPWGYGYAPWGYGYASPWYPYGPYPYGYWMDGATSEVRIDADQVGAEVYVDGYRAGVVDDYDGVFQRLRLEPGEHELVLYLNGYRTIREPLFLNARSTRTFRLQMERLGPGETSEPPPAPTPRAQRERDRDPELPPRQDRPYDRQPVEPEQRIEIAPETRFGTLSLRIQPGDAEVLIDGERWTTTPGDNRMNIRLSAGRHKIEIRKDGFERYSEEIGVRENITFTLNVSFKRQ